MKIHDKLARLEYKEDKSEFLSHFGVAFTAEDVPELPYQLKQKYYCSFVAKLQFAATWIRIDISFAVSQLASSF